MQVVGLFFVYISEVEHKRVYGTTENPKMETETIPCNMCSLDDAHEKILKFIEPRKEIHALNGMFVENGDGRYLCFDATEMKKIKRLRSFKSKVAKKFSQI